MISGKAVYVGDGKESLQEWQVDDLVAYKLKLIFPFHALCCREIQETVDIIPSALDPAEVRSKIWAFDVLTPGCLNALPLHQMVPVACWEQPGSVTGPTCGFNYSAWRGDAVERKERGK